MKSSPELKGGIDRTSERLLLRSSRGEYESEMFAFVVASRRLSDNPERKIVVPDTVSTRGGHARAPTCLYSAMVRMATIVGVGRFRLVRWLIAAPPRETQGKKVVPNRITIQCPHRWRMSYCTLRIEILSRFFGGYLKL